jgi:multicomponent Na+:H+ antiporter subunit C
MNFLLTHFNYVVVIVIMMAGLLILFSSGNLIKRMVGLALLQSSIGLLYISLAKVAGATAPILVGPGSEAARNLADRLDPSYVAQYGLDGVVYSNPLPHVLILTAIVVGVSTLAVGLAIAVRVREAYDTVEADEIELLDRVASPPEPAS